MPLADLYQVKFKPQALVLWLALLCLPSTAFSEAEVRRSTSVDDRVDQLEKQLQTANRMRAETQFQITNLQKEIRDLRGIIEEQAYQIEQITSRQRAIYQELDSLRAGQSGNNTSAVNNDTSVTDSSGSDTTTPDTTTQSTAVSESDIRAEYDAIFALVRATQYDEAIVEFQKFIAAYPDSELISNVRYWLGQIYNVKGRTDEAEREYIIVSQQYPDSAKAPDSLLKLGELYEKRGQTAQAVQNYQQLLTNYPDSNPARFAQDRLHELGS